MRCPPVAQLSDVIISLWFLENCGVQVLPREVSEVKVSFCLESASIFFCKVMTIEERSCADCAGDTKDDGEVRVILLYCGRGGEIVRVNHEASGVVLLLEKLMELDLRTI